MQTLPAALACGALRIESPIAAIAIAARNFIREPSLDFYMSAPELRWQRREPYLRHCVEL